MGDIQEVANITALNIEDIYEKDILRLQNFQNIVKKDLWQIKQDFTETLAKSSLKERQSRKDSKVKEKIMKIESALREFVKEANQKQLEDENLTINIANIVSDIDNLKKEKQSNL